MLLSLILCLVPAFAGDGPIIDDTPNPDVPELAIPFTEHNQHPRVGLESPNRLRPAGSEWGHYTGVRFDAEDSWDVRWVQFYAPNSTAAGATCTTELDREVKVFVTRDTTPPATPVILTSVTVPGRAARNGSINLFHVDLPSSVVVAPGESVWVMIEMPGTPDGVGCLTVGQSDSSERDYWSNATDAPYDWQLLEDFAIYTPPLVSIGGYQVF